MLSLRAFARRAPRNAFQIARLSTRPPARPAVQSFLRSKPLLKSRYQPFAAAFSTTSSRFDDRSQELSVRLNHEIGIEEENNNAETASNTNVKSFMDENAAWEFEDNQGEQDVLMKRTYDDEQITVSFSIADFNTPSMMPEEEADDAFADEEEDIETAQSGGANTKGAVNQGRTSGGNIKVAPEDSIAPADRDELRNEEDDEPQQAFPANVYVLIQRPSKEGALRIHLITDGTAFTVHEVTHVPTASSTSAKDLLRGSEPQNVYTGPPFQQLDEELQSNIEQYLEARGIDASLAFFIPDYIDVKEQREYLAWLGRMKEFVE